MIPLALAVCGKPWPELLADCDLSRGRIWIVVLIATFTAPLLALRLRT